MIEVWKDVVGYEGLYQVSNAGSVKRVAAGQGTKTGVLKLFVKENGYAYCHLCKGGKSRSMLIHRLVCMAFLGERDDLDVNHKDGDRRNNHLDNLEWVTRSENNLHKTKVLGSAVGKKHYAFGKCGEESKSAKKFLVTSPAGEQFVIVGLVEFCRNNGLTHSAMSQVASGKRNHHKQWKCEYHD